MTHKHLIAILFLFSFSLEISAQTLTGTIVHDGITRNYILHLPAGYDESIAYPFVYNLHGFTSTAQQQQFYSEMDQTADENGFIVCYPNGVGTSWNVGWNFGSTADDVGFLETLADVLVEDYSINSDRLYACGMSNGGFMSYILACEASDKFAAIASVTGAMVPSALASCNGMRYVPVMQIHGTADPTVDYNGSFISAPVEEVVTFWADRNGCNLSPETIDIEDVDPTDGCTAERITYADCDDGATVIFYRIDGGGHTWPDAALTIGTTNRDFNASQEIWNFFSQFDINGVILSNSADIDKVQTPKVSPNPTSDVVIINNIPSGVGTLTVIDINGKIVKSWPAPKKVSTQIDVSDLAQGLYFVVMGEGLQRTALRFVKL